MSEEIEREIESALIFPRLPDFLNAFFGPAFAF